MCRVLVIDDEPMVLRAMQLLIESRGYTVAAAAGLAEALNLVENGYRPEAILADYRLRGQQTGVGVIHAVCGACEQAIPAVIVTGDTAPERIFEIRSHGYEILHKPVHPDRIDQVVASLCAEAHTGNAAGCTVC
ncbi:MAG: response regulator [Magnetospirillum sp.]|nr:response regulator [Magnetospirillum sp.]